jgi:DNA-binding NarL/FixJ family response regulator
MSHWRVLIVDNQRGVRRSLRSGLESLEEDFEILEATSGEEALLVFAGAPADILVTGVRLAGISGLELMQRLRQRQPKLKVLLTAANPDAHISQQALQAHANALIAKPIEIADFIEAIQRCLDEGEAAPRPAEQQSKPSGSLSQHLETQCQEMGAAATVLLDSGGEILGQAGDSAKAQMVMPLVPALLEALGASARLSQALQRPMPDDLLCYSGAKIDLFAAHVGQPYALLVVFDSETMGNTRARAARLVSSAVRELAALLPQPEATPEPQKEVEAAPPAPQVKKVEKNTGDLKVALDQAEGIHLDPQDVESFWESAAEGQNGGSGENSEGLSFDQAQDMGIIQDE